MSLVFILVIDSFWLSWLGGFYARQLETIGRFDESGAFAARLAPAILVYLLMALAIEAFVFSNKNLKTLGEHVFYGGLLGLVIYGVFDGTNRAILADYPLEMMIVDMIWGTCLFAAVSAINFQLRHRIRFL